MSAASYDASVVESQVATELPALFAEFAEAATRGGPARERLDAWASIRTAARRHWEELLDAERLGRDVCEDALWKLLPHADGPPAQSHGAFVHELAPAVGRDLRAWFEGAGWVRASEWPGLGRGLFDFVRRCADHAAELWPASEAFLTIPGAGAFTSEMVSPILHALRPTEFVLVDASSRTLLNHATGAAFSGSLRDYPAAHGGLRRLLTDLRPVVAASPLSDRCPADVLEGFCHWLVHTRLMRHIDEELPSPEESLCLDAAPASAEVEPEALPEASAEPSPEPPPPPADGASEESADAGEPEPDLAAETAESVVEMAGEAVPEPVLPEAVPAEALMPEAALPEAAMPEPPIAEPPSVAPVHADLAPSESEPFESSLFEPAFLEPAALDMLSPDEPATERAAPTPLDRARDLLGQRGQIVLAGPAGSERRRLARQLADDFVAVGDGLAEHVVFHPSWRYADFLQAGEPEGAGRAGLFVRLCREAAGRTGPCILLVDEAEHADTAAVCGEALALLDARGQQVTLAGGGRLAVPFNVRVVFALDPASRAGRAALALLQRSCAVVRLGAALPDAPAA